MKTQIIEKLIIILCITAIILRINLTTENQITILMLVVNGLAMWLSLVLIFEKAIDIMKKRLKKQEKDYLREKGYRNLVKFTYIVSWILAIVIFLAFRKYRYNGDYITIITLGITLTDDMWGSLIYCFFEQ